MNSFIFPIAKRHKKLIHKNIFILFEKEKIIIIITHNNLLSLFPFITLSSLYSSRQTSHRRLCYKYLQSIPIFMQKNPQTEESTSQPLLSQQPSTETSSGNSSSSQTFPSSPFHPKDQDKLQNLLALKELLQLGIIDQNEFDVCVILQKFEQTLWTSFQYRSGNSNWLMKSQRPHVKWPRAIRPRTRGFGTRPSSCPFPKWFLAIHQSHSMICP